MGMAPEPVGCTNVPLAEGREGRLAMGGDAVGWEEALFGNVEDMRERAKRAATPFGS